MSSASLLAGLLLFAAPGVAGGKGGDPCDAPAAIRGSLADLAVEDLKLPERESEARELKDLKRLVDRHPTEPLLWRRYVERRRRSGEDAAAIAGELAERARRRPRDLAIAYAAALAGGQGNDQETARQLEALVERAPQLTEARLSLVDLYRSAPAKDQARLDQQVEALKKLCPASVRLARDLPRDNDLTAQAAAALQVQLQAGLPADPEPVRWLWSQASRRRRGGGTAGPDRAALLEQVKKDLKRWRSSRLATRPAFLPVLAQGYRLSRDREGLRWAEDQILRRLPASSEAARIAVRRFAIEHPEPLPSDPPETRAEHARALLEASADWTKRWPGSTVVWQRRLAALRRAPADPGLVIETARNAMAALDQHPRSLRTEPPLARQVAQLSHERGIPAADIPGLAERAGDAVAATEPAKPLPSTSPPSARTPLVRFTLDTKEFPDLAPWAARAAQVCEAWYPLIVDILSTDGFVPASEVKMVYRAGMSVPGSASGRTLNLNGEHVRRNQDEVGMLIHELTHVVQAFGGPSWLTEGIADYIRWHVFEAPKLRMNPARASYEDGYRVTGAFLAWTANTYDRKLVRRLNAALRSNGYDEELFRVFTGKDLDTLWAEWIAAGAPAAMGPDAPQKPPATFVPPTRGS